VKFLIWRPRSRLIAGLRGGDYRLQWATSQHRYPSTARVSQPRRILPARPGNGKRADAYRPSTRPIDRQAQRGGEPAGPDAFVVQPGLHAARAARSGPARSRTRGCPRPGPRSAGRRRARRTRPADRPGAYGFQQVLGGLGLLVLPLGRVREKARRSADRPRFSARNMRTNGTRSSLQRVGGQADGARGMPRDRTAALRAASSATPRAQQQVDERPRSHRAERDHRSSARRRCAAGRPDVRRDQEEHGAETAALQGLQRRRWTASSFSESGVVQARPSTGRPGGRSTGWGRRRGLLDS